MKLSVCNTFPVFPSVFFGIPTQNLNVSNDFSDDGVFGGAEAAASVMVVIEELALLVTVDSVSGGGRGSDACEEDECIEKLGMGEDPVEDEPEMIGAEAIWLEAVMDDEAVVALDGAPEFCESFPERRMSFVILMLHIRDTIPDCWKSPTIPFTW